MRGSWSLLLSLLLLGLPSAAQIGRLPKPAFALQATVEGGESIRLVWNEPEGASPRSRQLLRSTTDLRATLDGRLFPVAAFDLGASRGGFLDEAAPQGVELFYRVRLVYPDGKAVYSAVAPVTLKAPPLPTLRRPRLLIDKSAYLLTVFDGEQAVRRFPIALGANPVGRKLHQDRASTPEGFYTISALQPRATYHRAYDLNYPNEVDRARYNVMAASGGLPNPKPSIGGEIQIHGFGITGNWTWGCIALRDADMDLLFSHPEIARGVSVTVVGLELDLADLQSERTLTSAQREAVMEHLVASQVASGRTPTHWLYGLCKLQAHNGLMVTGVFDRATRRLLEKQGVLRP